MAGAVGMVLVVLGAGQGGSPFTSKLPGSWIFGIPPAGTARGGHQLLGIVAVYAGIVAVLCAWYCLVTYGVARGDGPLRRLYGVLGLWVAPLLIAPPLFSRDVYTYGAEGQLVARGINPYTHGLQSVRGSTFFGLADPLWRHAHAPYGPVFFDIARWNAHLSSGVFATVEGYRFVALAGVALMAVSIPALARSFGGDPATALSLAVLNPLVLLCLVGGMHNDAFMLGLLVAGVALARRGHRLLGIVVCALGAEVKIPAAIGIVFIGWAWAGAHAPPRRRARYLVESLVVGGAAMAVVSAASGLGWGWLWSLRDPGTVDSWLDPATAVGLALSHLVHGVGAGQHTHALVAAARAVALGGAGVIVVILLSRTDRIGIPRALGWSLLAVVFLGPIVWPWYETWGIVFLALAADRLSRRVVLVLSAVASFATVPRHVSANPADVAVAVAAALVVAATAAASVRWVRRRAIPTTVDPLLGVAWSSVDPRRPP